MTPATNSSGMIDPRSVKADAPQLKLSKNELNRLAIRVREDYNADISDHQARMRRFTRYYQLWRKRSDIPAFGEEDTSNFRVPLIQWQVYSKWAKEHGALFGSDAEIVARAIGPDDQRRVRKVARFMTWRAFHSLKIVNRAAIFNFRKILNGRVHAKVEWIRDTFEVPTKGGGLQECVHYDGPGFEPLWPDDFIVPAEDVTSVQEFSHVIEKMRRTPDQLLRGEDEGRYQGIRNNFDDILHYAKEKKRRDWQGEDVKREKDLAEGVTYEGALSAADCLTVHRWFGKWRMLTGRGDAREDNLARRDPYETDVLVTYLPDLDLIIGVQNLAEMYPLTKQRRPFVEAALVEDGSYWSPGFGELLEELEDELSVNYNLATEGGQFSVGPVILYKPASGFNPDTFEYRPHTAIASEDPAGVRVVDFKGDVSTTVIRGQELITYGERVTGQTDMNIGRTQDRPNAPRTARQTVALLEEGDVRASLETSALREHWGDILTWMWSLEQMYGSPRTFFRVTEEEAGGMFPVARGGTHLDEADRTGRYDFDLKFATSATARETKKQEQLALYQLDLQNPLVVNNPRALWTVLNNIHKAFGDERFRDIIPEPPALDAPIKPIDEWTRMLEHEDVYVNPQDNDQMHIEDHNRRLTDSASDPNRDEDAYRRMEMHVIEHIRAMQQKKLMGELVGRLATSLRDPSGGLFQATTPISLQNLHSTVGAMIQPEPAPQPQPGGKQ